MEAYQALTYGRPSHKSSFATLSGQGRSHHSLPPPSRSNNYPGATSFSATFNRMSNQSRVTSTSSATSITAKDVHLPGDLEKVLTVLAGGILEGHIKLAAALRRRYEDQYPLVRSLADVFAAHVRLTTSSHSPR